MALRQNKACRVRWQKHSRAPSEPLLGSEGADWRRRHPPSAAIAEAGGRLRRPNGWELAGAELSRQGGQQALGIDIPQHPQQVVQAPPLQVRCFVLRAERLPTLLWFAGARPDLGLIPSVTSPPLQLPRSNCPWHLFERHRLIFLRLNCLEGPWHIPSLLQISGKLRLSVQRQVRHL